VGSFKKAKSKQRKTKKTIKLNQDLHFGHFDDHNDTLAVKQTNDELYYSGHLNIQTIITFPHQFLIIFQ
jgi:hypothetical protein